MKKPLIAVLILFAVAVSTYYPLNYFYPEKVAEAKKFLSIDQRQDEATAKTKLQLTINKNLDSSLAAVLKNESTGQGAVIFSEMIAGTEYISKIVIKGSGDDTATVNVNERSQPTSLEYRGYLMLFDDYVGDTVHLTVRKPNRKYETADEESLVGIKTSGPILGQSRWDILQKKDDSGYRKFLIEQGAAILNIVGCTALKSSLLPTPNTDDSLAFVGCKNITINEDADGTVIKSCENEIIDCAIDTITHLKTIKESNSLDAQTTDEELDEVVEPEKEFVDETVESVIDPKDQDEVFDLMSNIDAVGTLVASFSQTSINEQGLNEKSEGIVSISFAGRQGACKMAARSTTSGTPQAPESSPPDIILPPVAIVNTTTSSVCTGELNEETGQFELEGLMQTNTKAESGRLEGVKTSGMGAFHILGLLQEGRVSGTIFYANKALELRPQQTMFE